MTPSRFEPQPDKPYGHCRDCGQEMPTEQEANDHMGETMKASAERRSHAISVTNPGRSARVRSAIRDAIDNAVRDAVDEVDQMVENQDINEAEARNVLSDEFLDEFEDRRR